MSCELASGHGSVDSGEVIGAGVHWLPVTTADTYSPECRQIETDTGRAGDTEPHCISVTGDNWVAPTIDQSTFPAHNSVSLCNWSVFLSSSLTHWKIFEQYCLDKNIFFLRYGPFETLLMT